MTYTQEIDTAAQQLAVLHGRDWSDMGTYEQQAYRDEVAKNDIPLRWDIERPSVFVGRVGAAKIVGRVVQRDDEGWEWAFYSRGVTKAAGVLPSFSGACMAVKIAYRAERAATE